MKLTIKIDMGNAAFEDNSPGVEIDLILNRFLNKLPAEPQNMDFHELRDTNGNIVGEAEFTV